MNFFTVNKILSFVFVCIKMYQLFSTPYSIYYAVLEPDRPQTVRKKSNKNIIELLVFRDNPSWKCYPFLVYYVIGLCFSIPVYVAVDQTLFSWIISLEFLRSLYNNILDMKVKERPWHVISRGIFKHLIGAYWKMVMLRLNNSITMDYGLSSQSLKCENITLVSAVTINYILQ